MSTELFANQSQTIVTSGGGTTPTPGTSETWVVSSGSTFPTADPTAYPPTYFRITDPAASSEKMTVTDSRTTSWAVTRGAEGTACIVHASGFAIQNVVTAGTLSGLAQLSDLAIAKQVQRMLCV